MAKKKPASDKAARIPRRKVQAPESKKPRLYTLEVCLISGPITEKFAKKNPEVSRTIQIRGDQTLDDLHDAIFDAFGRFDPHMYEFQFGKRPMDPKGLRYVARPSYEIQVKEGEKPTGRTDQTTLDSLGLRKDQAFGYWFDFGDDWWHQIDVEAIENEVPKGKYLKVIKTVGANPPQYL